MDGEKTYLARLVLGKTTDTQDFTGRVLAEQPVDAAEWEIAGLFQGFLGRQKQQPPSFSALKHRGVPLYRLARKGQMVQKPARDVDIKALGIISMKGPVVDFQVTCSSGTYIRTLCHDMGAKLGCGGHLGGLRRISASGFSIQEAVTLEAVREAKASGELALAFFLDARMISMADALRKMPRHTASPDMARQLVNGEMISAGDIGPAREDALGGPVKIVDEKGRLLAVLRLWPDRQKAEYLCNFAGSKK